MFVWRFSAARIDSGKQSLETICLLLAYKVKYPENVFLLRGNHESAQINRYAHVQLIVYHFYFIMD